MTPEQIDLSNPLGIVFGLMPPEAQEAMKAHGGPWEVFSYGRWGFWGGAQYEWSSDRAYRVKPASKVVTVTLYGGREGDTAEYGFYEIGAVVQSHRITFNLIDGKPDCASIKMEEL